MRLLPCEWINAWCHYCRSRWVIRSSAPFSSLYHVLACPFTLLPWDNAQRSSLVAGTVLSDFLASRTVRQMDLFSLYVIQSEVFCYSNGKQTMTPMLFQSYLSLLSLYVSRAKIKWKLSSKLQNLSDTKDSVNLLVQLLPNSTDSWTLHESSPSPWERPGVANV